MLIITTQPVDGSDQPIVRALIDVQVVPFPIQRDSSWLWELCASIALPVHPSWQSGDFNDRSPMPALRVVAKFEGKPPILDLTSDFMLRQLRGEFKSELSRIFRESSFTTQET